MGLEENPRGLAVSCFARRAFLHRDARVLVVALGPWSDTVTPLGYDFPLAVIRGYQMHYEVQTAAELRHPVLDADFGHMLAP